MSKLALTLACVGAASAVSLSPMPVDSVFGVLLQTGSGSPTFMTQAIQCQKYTVTNKNGQETLESIGLAQATKKTEGQMISANEDIADPDHLATGTVINIPPCTFPLPSSNSPETVGYRWKLSNGPVFKRLDDNLDHGASTRIVGGEENTLSVEACMDKCRERDECQSGHYCSNGGHGHAGKCIMSSDWDPYGVASADGCNVAQNFRKANDWVKPVLRLGDGTYQKTQWHSTEPIDEDEDEDQSVDNSRISDGGNIGEHA